MTGSPPAAAARTAGPRRRARFLLLALLVVTALLRLWYLPSSERLASESPGIDNVQAVLAGSDERDYRATPLAWLPQSAAVRLVAGLHDGRPGRWSHVATPRHRMTVQGLAVARLPSVAYGTGGVLLLFLVGRRLHTAGVGLLAALALSFSPWHIQASVSFAPDVLVLTLSLLALWLALRALDRPSAARLALVGLALGGAAAVAPSGALVAPPVLAALVFGGGGGLRGRLLPLAVAAPVAALTWWALTPPSGLYLAALELEEARQIKRAAREASSRFTVAAFALLHPLREAVHGRLLGALALLGLAGQAFRCLCLLDPGPDRAHRLMVLAAWPTFALGYAWATPLFRESGFVPLVAYSSLYAAVMLAVLWRGLAGMAAPLRAPWARLAASLLALALVVPAGWRYVHSSAVTSTASVAVDWLRKQLGEAGPRLVLVEEAALAGGAAGVMQLAGGIGLQVVGRLAEVETSRLDRADGVIFRRRELGGADAQGYEDRRRAADRQRVVESSWLRRRGPDLVAAAHPYDSRPPREIELAVERHDTRRLAIVPAARKRTAAVSLVVRLPATREASPAPPRAWLDEQEISLAPAGFFPRDTLFLSERLPPADVPRGLWIEPPPWMAARRGEISAALYAWR